MSNGTNDDERDPAHQAKMQRLQARQREELKDKTIKRGIVVVLTGDGKGKSTSAFGTALRALGHGQRVGLVQFIKGTWKTGEGKMFENLEGLDHVVSGDGFTWNTQDRQKDIASVRRGWEVAMAMVDGARAPSPKYHLVVLDELNIALQHGYISAQEVVEVMRNKPDALNVIITGRGAPPELIEVADTVTEMAPVKHAYSAGIRAQKGVDF